MAEVRVYGFDDELVGFSQLHRMTGGVRWSRGVLYATGGSAIMDNVALGGLSLTPLQQLSGETLPRANGPQALLDDGQGNVTQALSMRTGTPSCVRFYQSDGTTLASNSSCRDAGNDANTWNQRWYRGGHRNQTDGTYTFGSRRYDPETGTWTTPDTARPGAPVTDLSIGVDPLTQNRYTYVNGDPVNMTDPTGHCSESQVNRAKEGRGGMELFRAMECKSTRDMASSSVDVHANRASELLEGAQEHGLLYSYDLPVDPSRGVINVNSFVSQDEVGRPIAPSEGNGRDFSSSATCVETKVCIVADYDSGKLTIFVSETVSTDGSRYEPDGQNDLSVDIDSQGNVLIRASVVNPLAPNLPVFGKVPSIDMDVTIGDFHVQGVAMNGIELVDGQSYENGAALDGDVFPSVEAYRSTATGVETLFRDRERWHLGGVPWGLFPVGGRVVYGGTRVGDVA